MNLFAMMDTSGGAMEAERMRAEVVATNMANVETTRTAGGGPYRRQEVVFAANPGDPEFSNSFNAAVGGSAAGAGSAAETGSAWTGTTGTGATGTAAANSDITPLPPLPAFLPPLTPLNLNGDQSDVPGVHIAAVVQDPSEPLKRYDPGNPDAGKDGYVEYPNINPVTEMVDLMGATRAYGLNSSAVQAEKTMISSALDIAKS